MEESGQRLVIVSNRLPVVLSREGGEWEVRPGEGGLVTALAPVLRNRGGVWIGWPGAEEAEGMEEALAGASASAGFDLKAVPLTADEMDKYYHGFSNEVLWPLFHDLHAYCNFDPEYWASYRSVNRKFAEVAARHCGARDFLWVHDYHLIPMAAHLRELGFKGRIGFFLHVPFPPMDIYLKMPWRFPLLEDLLSFDLIGFQTQRDRRNFLQCVRRLVKGTTERGKGQVSTVCAGGREIRVGSFPISIDFNDFAARASSKEVSDEAWMIHEKFPNRQMMLGLDRLDYSKGIPERVKAFGNALDRHEELRENLVLVQVVVPSRVDIPSYRRLKERIELEIGRVNGRFTTRDWVPVVYMFKSLDKTELLAYYRTCEIALITPLKDGMNLVAKEYCAASVEDSGVLILSEFAGAASQMHRNALMVNPYDVTGTADAIATAFGMPWEERKARMRRLRRQVKDNDIFRWLVLFLRAAFEKDIDDFPLVDDWGPTMSISGA